MLAKHEYTSKHIEELSPKLTATEQEIACVKIKETGTENSFKTASREPGVWNLKLREEL